MQSPEHLSSEEEVPLPEDFQNANAIIDSISQPKDSQPTKLRVKNFKNRVFHLIKIFTTQSSNVNPLVQSLKQEIFLKEPEKMRELLNDFLNKQNIDLENLQQLLEYHKVILLYKNDRVKGDSIAIDFIKILKKISLIDANIANETILDLLKSFAFVRKSKLNINFFFYFFRNFQGSAGIKKTLLEKCEEYINDPKLRNAQKKQLTKLRNKLDKSSKPKPVKMEENQQDDDEIKIVGKKINNSFKGLKAQKKEEEHEGDKIEEEVTGEKPKKEITEEQKEKLQRIKDNKKKNRKQNKSKPKPEQPNVQKNGQQRKDHNQKNQRTPSKQKRHFSKSKGKQAKGQKK